MCVVEELCLTSWLVLKGLLGREAAVQRTGIPENCPGIIGLVQILHSTVFCLLRMVNVM